MNHPGSGVVTSSCPWSFEGDDHVALVEVVALVRKLDPFDLAHVFDPRRLVTPTVNVVPFALKPELTVLNFPASVRSRSYYLAPI